MDNNCGFFTQRHSVINGCGVWHYLIASPIGNFHIVEWEDVGHGIHRKIYEDDNDKAERKYNTMCRQLLKL